MRQNPSFTLASEEGVKRLIREHPWMTIVSHTDGSGLMASHYPVLLDEQATGTVGLRIPITRFVAKNKMSQNKPAETVDRIIGELEAGGPYANPSLAAEMRRTHEALRAARA